MRNPYLANRNNAAIYCRLSSEDGDIGDSQSIAYQRDILTKYCLEHGFNIYSIYVDDGYSGTNFNRPGFQKLIEDIECGLIDIVITKDLSRLGRDYLSTGKYIEQYFPENNVRYIAVNDNVDTEEVVDDIVPIKNILNEFYAKDISKKIRSTKRFQNETGAVRNTGKPMYGYLYDIENNKRVVNPETAPIVVKIFELYTKGYSLKGISDYLLENKVLSPEEYLKKASGKENKENPYIWLPRTISRILRNQEYLGHYIKGKYSKTFKGKTKEVPIEKQYIFKNRFDPIIKKEVFDIAQEMFIKNKNNSALTNPYANVVYCAVCGRPMRIQRHKGGSGTYEERLVCANVNEFGKGSILLDDLNLIMKKELEALQEVILNHKEEFLSMALERIERLNLSIDNTENEMRLTKVNNRMKEIDNYIKNLFEESITQGLPEDTYKKLMNEYTYEKKSLEMEKHKYELLIDDSRVDASNVQENLEAFINTLSNMDDNNYNSHMILRSIVSKIMISTFKQESDKHILGKSITICYKHCDSFIKEFIQGKENEDGTL